MHISSCFLKIRIVSEEFLQKNINNDLVWFQESENVFKKISHFQEFNYMSLLKRGRDYGILEMKHTFPHRQISQRNLVDMMQKFYLLKTSIIRGRMGGIFGSQI